MVVSFEMANNHSSLTKLIPRQPQIASIKYELTSVLGHGQLVRVSGEELCVKTADLGRMACGQSATAGADMIKTNNRISTQNSSSGECRKNKELHEVSMARSKATPLMEFCTGCDYVVKKTVESRGQGSWGGEASG